MENCNIPRWQRLKSQLNNLSPPTFKKAIETLPDAILLDCRTAEEFAFSRIKNAVHFDYLTKNFVEEMERLDPQATYLIYCRSERRSLRTCMLLQNGGFEKVYNLDGGLIEWMEIFGDDGLERSDIIHLL